MPDADAAAREEAGRLLFARECAFVAGAARIDQLPGADAPEVAFAGRSNVGKSSLINALAGRAALARTSNTPGRTRQINFFALAGDRLRLVDLPGYGYARAAKSEIAAWTGLVDAYLRGRPNLRRAALLVDARRGLMPPDRRVMAALDRAAVAYQLVLTKADALTAAQLERRAAEAGAAAREHAAAHPAIVATSARRGAGIAALRAELAALAAVSNDRS